VHQKGVSDGGDDSSERIVQVRPLSGPLAVALLARRGTCPYHFPSSVSHHAPCCSLTNSLTAAREALAAEREQRWVSKGTRALESGGSSKLLVVVLLLGLTGSASSSRSPLPLNSASPGSTVGGGEGKVDVLCKKGEGWRVVSELVWCWRREGAGEERTLGLDSDNERGNVDNLLSNPDVPLSDEDSGVVDRLGKPRLEDLSLESSLHEVLGLEGKERGLPCDKFCERHWRTDETS
jgi:hypothetical protein